MGDLASIVGGGTPSTSNTEYWDGDIDWYAPAEIGEQIYVSKSKKTITELGLKKSSARILPVGTVLFTSRAGIGNTAILAKEATTNQGFQSIVPDQNKLDSYFIFSRTNELKRYGEVTGAGSTFVEVSGKQMSKMSIMVPELSEQQKIGSFFQQLDNTITLHQRKLDKLKTVKKAMLEKMFPKNGEKIPEIRFSGFTDDWEQRKLMSIIRNIIDFRGRTPKKLGLDWSDNGYLALSALNVKNGYIDFSQDAHYGNQELYDRWMSGKELYKNQVLFTTEAPMGNVAQVPDNKGYILSQRTIAFEVNEEYIIDDFLAIVLRSPVVFSDLTALSSGGTAKGVSQRTLNSLDFTIPKDIIEQTKIANYFKSLDHLITLHQRKLNGLKNVKKAMLEKMFPKNGESVPEIRFSGFTDDWEQRKVEGYASFLTGSGLSWDDISEDGEQECILYGNLYTDYGMITDKIVYKTNTKVNKPVYSKFGDVLIPASDTTPTGLARATSLEKSDVLLGGDINIIRPNEDINGSCLSLALNANKKELIRLIKGTTVRHIHNSDIKGIELSMSKSKAEQTMIAEYFKSLDHLITLHQRKLDKLKTLKKAMLEKMFI